jgi:hypothetical protein
LVSENGRLCRKVNHFIITSLQNYLRSVIKLSQL